MADQTSTNNIKIITQRPEGQKREFSSYVEFTVNMNELSLKFCDIKPPRPEEREEIQKTGKIVVPVNTEIVIPFIVAEEFSKSLEEQIKLIKERAEKGETK